MKEIKDIYGKSIQVMNQKIFSEIMFREILDDILNNNSIEIDKIENSKEDK